MYVSTTRCSCVICSFPHVHAWGCVLCLRVCSCRALRESRVACRVSMPSGCVRPRRAGDEGFRPTGGGKLVRGWRVDERVHGAGSVRVVCSVSDVRLRGGWSKMRASVHVRRSRRAWGGARLCPVVGRCVCLWTRGWQSRVPVDERAWGRVRLLRGLSSCGQADGEGCESGSLVCVVFGLGLSRSRSVLCTGTLGGWCLGVGRDAERRSQQLQLQLLGFLRNSSNRQHASTCVYRRLGPA